MLDSKFTTCSKCGKKPLEALSFTIGDQVLCESCEALKKGLDVEAVLNACRAAYKKGLIDAAQVICLRCREKAPQRGRTGELLHMTCWQCPASEIIELLEAAGGWQADWPDVSDILG